MWPVRFSYHEVLCWLDSRVVKMLSFCKGHLSFEQNIVIRTQTKKDKPE